MSGDAERHGERTLSLTQIDDALELESTSLSSYHLDHLEGVFLRWSESGYALNRAGEDVIVGLAVGVSAAAPTRRRAMTLGIAAYLALALLWDLVPQGAHVVEGATPAGSVPGWFVLLQGLSPSGAYSALVQVVVHATDASFPGIAGAVAGPPPAYLHWTVFAGVFGLWTILPLAAGYAVFARSDLG